MFAFQHFNFNVTDLERSINFYRDALGLREVRRREAEQRSSAPADSPAAG